MRLARPSRRAPLAGAVLAALAGAAFAGGATAPGGLAVREPCPPGYRVATERAERGFVRDATAADPMDRALTKAVDDRSEGAAAYCVSLRRPESKGELLAANGQLHARRTAPWQSVKPGAYEAALARRAALAQASGIKGTDGTWTPLGKGPLTSNDEGYEEVNGLGLAEVAGRTQDFAYDPATKTVYVSVANGGVYKSTDMGATWTSIGDRLPSQIVASVGFSPNAGGTVIVVTGDSAFGGNSLTGVGAYWTTDEGATWHKSGGIPDGVLGFRVAVDPSNPGIVYAATGGGLYRSTDTAKTFVNVNLPTGDCAGVVNTHPCFLANMVTDVVVQAPGGATDAAGGKVVAAVGWRAGNKPNEDGSEQSPANGIYGSDTGEKDSFVRLDAPSDGFAPQDQIGRIELGAAEGPEQDHEILYAIVGDAIKFNDGDVGGLEFPDDVPAQLKPGYNTNLAGIWVSRDFGDTWTLMTSGDALAQIEVASSGSALAGTAQGLGAAPGYQAWYNMWIRPDPTQTDPATGAPTRLLFGLEEVWKNRVPAPQIAATNDWEVIGRYFADETCFFLSLGLPKCPTTLEDDALTTTHPDQHGALFVPGEEGEVTVLVGNDGGVYVQTKGPGEDFDNDSWGVGHNRGFQTLLPYDAKMSGDGTVWAGLQDNGHMKITPGDERQITTMGGDGTFAAVDPNASEVAWESLPGGLMYRTSDGGLNWSEMDPVLTNPGFITPFALDPKDPEHLIVAGKEVVETLSASTVGSSTLTGPPEDPTSAQRSEEWVVVYDLGSNPDDEDIPNRMSAIDLDGDHAYVGFCGYCDVLTQSVPFRNGIATNVGGDEPPEAGSSAGWHHAAAAGLPNRYITGITIDPADPETVYVTLGGYGRKWAPPGAVGEDVSDVGEGHLYKSTDAGATFTDISGDLPDVPANWVEVRGEQLLVATDVGVFASTGKDGGRYGLLGDEFELPVAPVFTLQLPQHDPNLMVAATFGRGVWTYRFADPAPQPTTTPPTPVPSPTRSRPTGGLPSTGGDFGLVLLAAGGVAGAALLARRRRRAGRHAAA